MVIYARCHRKPASGGVGVVDCARVCLLRNVHNAYMSMLYVAITETRA